MKAVNLIPADQRRGAGGTAGRAGGAVYVLVGGLVVLVLMSVIYAVSASQVSDRQSKLASVSAEADVQQSQATVLQPYVAFAAIRHQREQAIASLTASRFDWSSAMDQIARALPSDVTLSALTGGPAATGPGGLPAPAAPAAPAVPGAAGVPAASGPSVALTGCAITHSEVANVLNDLHAILGVTGVSLATSQKATTGPTATAPCPGPTFTATLAYGANTTPAAKTTTSQGVTASTATSPTAGSPR